MCSGTLSGVIVIVWSAPEHRVVVAVVLKTVLVVQRYEASKSDWWSPVAALRKSEITMIPLWCTERPPALLDWGPFAAQARALAKAFPMQSRPALLICHPFKHLCAASKPNSIILRVQSLTCVPSTLLSNESYFKGFPCRLNLSRCIRPCRG